LAELEQGTVGEAPVAVSLGGRDETGQQRGPHRRKFGRDRIAQDERRSAAAEKRRMLGRDERPGHGLDEPA
jgi:hypothetical protein